MKQSFFIDSTDGNLKWIQKLPTVEEFITAHGSGNLFQSFHEDMYNREIEFAKKGAMDVDEQSQLIIAAIVSEVRGQEKLTHDKIYIIDMEEEIEIVCTDRCKGIKCTPGKTCDGDSSHNCHSKVARIIPKKAEESDDEIREAIISILEESWDIITPMPTPFMFDFMALLKANGFEIKRKV
jgi:hypothetical protein